MRVENTNNNIIDITFDPSVEGICLLDFVIVEEGKEKYLAQVISLAGDRYDASLNLARVQIIYKINEKNEIVPYDGFTPTRTSKITVCNQKEIEDFINTDKETVEFSTNPKTMLPLKINFDFFSNKPVILADKMDDFNLLSTNLAHTLSEYKNVIIFDYTGSLNVEDSARLRAGIDFKLPLNYLTIGSIWEDSMKDATIEVQAACEDIFNEVKSYLKTLRGKPIPYNLLLKTIIDEHKKEKSTELWFLRNKLVKYFEAQLFAQDIKDIELLSETIKENKITIIDFSNVEIAWHKTFCEFILSAVQQDVYLFMRLNDNTSNEGVINKIYGKTKINVIPSVSYGYKKLPSLAENFNNYIFLSTLNPIRNYGIVNPSILTLDANYALFYGEDTKGLIFKIQNTVNLDEEIKKRKKVRKIQIENFQKIDDKIEEKAEVKEIKQEEPANMVLETEGDVIPNLTVENTPIVPVKNEAAKEDDLIEEIKQEEPEEDFDMSEFQKQLNDDNIREELFSTPEEDYVFEDVSADLNRYQSRNIVEYKDEEETPNDDVEYDETGKLPELNNEEELEENFQNLFEEEQGEEEAEEKIVEEEHPPVSDEIEENYEFLSDNELDFYEEEQALGDEFKENDEPYVQEPAIDNELKEEIDEIIDEEIIEDDMPADDTEEPAEETVISPETIEETAVTPAEEPSEEILTPPQPVEENQEDEELYDEQLKAFLGEDEPIQESVQEPVQEQAEDNIQADGDGIEIEDIEISDNINIDDEAFLDVLNNEENEPEEQTSEVQNAPSSQAVEEKKTYDVIEEPQIVEVQEVKEPIKPMKSEFKNGELVQHDKYGIGKVLEVIEYSNRTLLQIEFADIGKRLLDPKIANIKHLNG